MDKWRWTFCATRRSNWSISERKILWMATPSWLWASFGQSSFISRLVNAMNLFSYIFTQSSTDDGDDTSTIASLCLLHPLAGGGEVWHIFINKNIQIAWLHDWRISKIAYLCHVVGQMSVVRVRSSHAQPATSTYDLVRVSSNFAVNNLWIGKWLPYIER